MVETIQSLSRSLYISQSAGRSNT